MNIVFNEILLGVKRSIGLLSKKEKRSLYIATFLMLITGILTNGPAVILGKLVDKLVGGNVIQFDVVVPFILVLCVVILVREGLTVVLKYLVQNIATQTGKDQTVQVIERLLKVDIGGFLYQQQIGSLYGRVFRSIEGHINFLCRTGSHRDRLFSETADGLRHDPRNSHRVVSDCQTSLFTERDSGCLITKEGTGRWQSS